jgi:two-component system, response regulator YesN
LEPSPETWEKTLQKCRSYKVDFIALEKAFYGLSRQNTEKLEAAARIMDRSAKYIHLSRLARIHELPLLEKVKAYVEQNLSREITVADLSQKLGFSSSHLSHSMKANLGVNLTQYVRSKRLEKAKQLLSETQLDVARIALETGFEDPNYFARIFKREAGISPTEYRTKNRNVAELC